MASIYRKGKSDVVWLRFKDVDGKWTGKPTSYRWSNFGDVRQAKLLARKQSVREAERADNLTGNARFADWVLPWLQTRYGGATTTTLDRYCRSWRHLTRYLDAHGLATPSHIRREFGEKYLAARMQTVGRNTVIGEIKLMAMVMREAVARGHVVSNPLEKLGLKKQASPEKEIWEDADLRRAAEHLERHGSRWMRAAFYFGIYQACRLRQCQLPLEAIRLDLGIIRYPDELVKGRSGFTQPIDPNFRPILEGLLDEARAEGARTICEIPWDASIRLRRTFDRAGLPGLCHHGLRATWITRAADKGVTENEAMAFAHHESREVHRIYKKLRAVVTAHVPTAVGLPALGGPCAEPDSPRARRGNARASSRSRKAGDSRA